MKAYLEMQEVEQLENTATCMRDKLFIRLLFHLGCRISEALALEVNNIDFERCTVTIQHLKSRIKLTCPQCGAMLGKSHAFCPKCGATVKEAVASEQEHRRVRTLPLDMDTLAMLKDYIARGGPVLKNGNQLIFLVLTVTLKEGIDEDPDNKPINTAPGYYGNVIMNGQQAPPGTTIIAKIGGEERGSITTSASGSYGDDPGPSKLWLTGYGNELTPIPAGAVSVGEGVVPTTCNRMSSAPKRCATSVA